MSLLKALVTKDTIKAETDNIGGSGVLDSGAYHSTITMAYAKKSDSGALGLFVTFKTEAGQELRQSLWMTGGTAKGGNNFYIDKDGKEQYLPGFNQANALALLTVGKPIAEVEDEEKVINLYNYDLKKEVPTKAQVLVELIGQEIIVGVIRQTVDKTAKNDAGVYIPTGDTRDENDIDKLFKASNKMTFAEISAQATEPAFFTAWSDKNTGVTKNKAKGTGTGGTSGAPKAAGGTAKPKSLFGA